MENTHECLSDSQTGGYIINLTKLNQNKIYAKFFEWAAETLNTGTTSIKKISAICGLSTPETISFCKELGECGRLVLGRHGKESRMEWSYTLNSIGEIALGKSEHREPFCESESDDTNNYSDKVTITYPLSSGSATIEFPDNLSDADAKKLLNFISGILSKN